jgi:hypothetical protein
MACLSCEERGKLIVAAKMAYHRGDYAEAKRLLGEMFGTAVRDWKNMKSMILKTPDGTVERFDFTMLKDGEDDLLKRISAKNS